MKAALLLLVALASAGAYVLPPPASLRPLTSDVRMGIREDKALAAKAEAAKAAAARKQKQAAAKAQAKVKADAKFRAQAAAKAAAAARRPKKAGAGGGELPFMAILRRQTELANQRADKQAKDPRYTGGFKIKF